MVNRNCLILEQFVNSRPRFNPPLGPDRGSEGLFVHVSMERFHAHPTPQFSFQKATPVKFL